MLVPLYTAFKDFNDIVKFGNIATTYAIFDLVKIANEHGFW